MQSRSELVKALDQLRPSDTLMDWRLAQVGRSLRHLVEQLSALQEHGNEFRSPQENLDASPRYDRFMFHIFVSLAKISLANDKRLKSVQLGVIPDLPDTVLNQATLQLMPSLEGSLTREVPRNPR